MVDTLVIVFWWMDTWQFPSFLKHFTTWRDRTNHKTRLLEARYFAKTSTWNSQASSVAKLEKLVAWAHAQFPARWRLARLARKGFGADGLQPEISDLQVEAYTVMHLRIFVHTYYNCIRYTYTSCITYLNTFIVIGDIQIHQHTFHFKEPSAWCLRPRCHRD